nr:LysR substrate-binding domain-containing protein [Streptomyces coryli]
MAAGHGVTGVLDVGYSSPMAADVVLAASRVFEAGHQDCQVRIREIQLHDPLGPLREGVVDLQVTEFPVDEPDITLGPVALSQQRGLLVPTGHPFAKCDSLSVEDYADAVMIPLIGDAIPPAWLDHHYPRSTPSGRPIPRARPATFWAEVLARVAAGEGVSLVSMGAEPYVSRPGLTFVPFRDAAPMEYGLMWLTAAESALVRAFADAVCDTAQSLP